MEQADCGADDSGDRLKHGLNLTSLPNYVTETKTCMADGSEGCVNPTAYYNSANYACEAPTQQSHCSADGSTLKIGDDCIANTGTSEHIGLCGSAFDPPKKISGGNSCTALETGDCGTDTTATNGIDLTSKPNFVTEEANCFEAG